MLCAELRGDAAERLRGTALLDPGDPRWRVDVDGRGGVFARIGVAEGLRVIQVDDLRFNMALYDYKLPKNCTSRCRRCGLGRLADGGPARSQTRTRRLVRVLPRARLSVARAPRVRGLERARARGVFESRRRLDSRLA